MTVYDQLTFRPSLVSIGSLVSETKTQVWKAYKLWRTHTWSRDVAYTTIWVRCATYYESLWYTKIMTPTKEQEHIMHYYLCFVGSSIWKCDMNFFFWRYPRVNQKMLIQGQTMQWPKRQIMDNNILHRKLMIEHHKSHLKPRCIERVSSSSSNSGTCRVSLVNNQMICHERGKKDGIVFTTKWSIYSS